MGELYEEASAKVQHYECCDDRYITTGKLRANNLHMKGWYPLIPPSRKTQEFYLNLVSLRILYLCV